jgi:hypothetical protein
VSTKAALRRARRIQQQMSKWAVDVLVNCEEGWNPNIADSSGPGGKPRLRLLPAKAKGTPHVISFPLTQLDGVASVRVYIHKDIRPIETRQVCTGRVSSRRWSLPCVASLTALVEAEGAARNVAVNHVHHCTQQ